VRLLALEVVMEFFNGGGLAFRLQRIYMLCRDVAEWDDTAAAYEGNVVVKLLACVEALAVKLLDVPGADAGALGPRMRLSDKVTAKSRRSHAGADLPLVSLSRSLLLAPLPAGEDGEGGIRRWTPGLEVLRGGDLALLGAGPDGVLSAKEMKQNNAALAELVECVRAELAVACALRAMEVCVCARAYACVSVCVYVGVCSHPSMLPTPT
jgi:hypothetical protein